eukprot:g81996.t1
MVPTLASSHRFTLQGWSRSVHITRLCFCRYLIMNWKTLLTLKKRSWTWRKTRTFCLQSLTQARVAAFLVGTKSSGLKTALRNDFDKIDRARITLVQVTDQLVKLREKNIVGKGEPGQGWIVNDPETGKTIRCNSKQEFDLEDYLIAIVAKMKAEKEEKEQEKLAQKALKREQALEMIRPQGEVMRSKVKTFAAALKLEGDPASWSKEILATNVDEATGRKLCQDAFAAQRKDREDKSLMISESDRLVASNSIHLCHCAMDKFINTKSI